MNSNYFFPFRTCTNIQRLFSKISTQITQEILEGKGITEWIKFNNPVRCNSSNAWDSSHEQHYYCTLQIAKSDPLISKIMNEIEEVSKLDLVTFEHLVNEIWLSFEGMTLQQQQDESMSMIKTFAKIIDLRTIRKIPSTICSFSQNCKKAFRKIVLQLKLIQLGYYGPTAATAGLYLARYRDKFGAYFTNSMDNKWPHQPLHRDPNQNEALLNEYLLAFTENLSTDRLKNVSLLDLPAFGSRISHLDEFQTNSALWPLETNFAILKKYKRSMLNTAFQTHKYLITLWKRYIDHIHTTGKYFPQEFPPNNIHHPFNFTEYIQDDFSMFLRVYLEAYPKASGNHQMDQIWRQMAEQVFEGSVNNGDGLFDKLFLDCSFKNSFMRVGEPLPGECSLFQQQLTSNGFCLSFNTVPPSSIWKDFRSVKALEEIMSIKPTKTSYFSGAGSNEGKLKIYKHCFTEILREFF